VDILACPGHKSLLGPTGTGFCYLSAELGGLAPILWGGTGSYSALEGMPDVLPDRFEAGTLNFHGIAGLKASLEYLIERGLDDVARREEAIADRMLDGIQGIPGLTLHGPRSAKKRLLVFSVTHAVHSPEVLGNSLSELHGITTRVGLHCAPWAHETFRTVPHGTLRISPGLFHKDEEIDFAVESLRDVVARLDR